MRAGGRRAGHIAGTCAGGRHVETSDRTPTYGRHQQERCDSGNGSAEGVGFEPTVSCPTHAFQACRFGRSRIPPDVHADGAHAPARRRRPGDLRHTAGSAESCCLPALTRFTGCRCTGPGRHLTWRAHGRVAGRSRRGSLAGSLRGMAESIKPSTAATGPQRFERGASARTTSSERCATRCATTGSATPTCSAAPAARARRRPPASSPRR